MLVTIPRSRDGARVVAVGVGEVTRATTVVAVGRVAARTVVVVATFVAETGTGGFVAATTGAGSAACCTA